MGIIEDMTIKLNEVSIKLELLQSLLDGIKDLNEKVDLLTIRKQVDRQDKEKRIKDTLSDEDKAMNYRS